MDYKEQMKSPKWQKRRLEIMNRDNFTCQMCGDTENELHVHHIKYLEDMNYWDYPDNLLITLCSRCHGREHLHKDETIFSLIEDLNNIGSTYTEICFILAYAYFNLKKKTEDNMLDIFPQIVFPFDCSGIFKNISDWRKSLKK